MIRNWMLPSVIGLAMAIAAYQGTLLATPYVLMSAAMKKIGAQTPVNSFRFGEPSTADNQPIVRPSPDLSYSSCVFDVSKGPVLVDAGPVPGSYWSLSIFDARTDVAQVLSERETGNGAARVMLIRDGIKLAPPNGYTPVRLKHDKGIALVRILVSSKADYPAIDAIRRKARCRMMES